MNSPLISIIVPVYQVESCLAECLDSILNQDFRDYEVLCIFDESTDRSWEILEQYAQAHACIRVLHGRGKNLSSARNDGLEVAQGKYILFLDSDDRYPQGALKTIAEKMEQTAADILVFNAHIFPTEPKPPMYYSNYLTTRDAEYAPFRPDALFRELGSRPYVWRNCFRRAFLEAHHLRFHEVLGVGEDQAFQLEAFPLAEKIVFTKEKLYCYRWLREGSLQYCYDRDPAAKLRGHMQIVQSVAECWQERGLMDAMRAEFAGWAIDLIYSEAVRVDPASDPVCLNEAAGLLAKVIPAGTALSAYDSGCLEEIRSGQFRKKDGFVQKYLGKLTHIVHLHGFRRTLILIQNIIFR